MKATIGIDLGTQGTKAGVYTTDGVMVGHAYGEHILSYPGPGLVELDGMQILDAAITAVGKAVRKAAEDGVSAESIHAISFSGILCGQIFVDENLDPVRSIIPFLDLRSAPLAQAAARDLEPIWESESGTSTLDAYAAPFPLQWVRDNEPETYARISRVLSLGPWVAARFAGLDAAGAYTDPTHMSGWVVGWDAATGDYSDRQFELFGLDRSHAPRVVPSDSVIGHVTASVAERTGLPAGTPIVAGAGDVMQSNLASGLLEAGQATDVAGTASIFTVGVDGIVPQVTQVPGMLYSLATIPGQSFYWGYVRAGGLSLRWFRDRVAGLPPTDASYAQLDEAAGQVGAGADGVLFLPYLSGGNPDNPHASGSWLGLTAAADTKILWRSVLESIAFEYNDLITEFAAAGTPVEQTMVVGGGARSPIWNQIKADVTGVPWTVPTRTDGAILANAALAACGADLTGGAGLADLLRTWNVGGTTQQPDPQRHARYTEVFAARNSLLRGPMREVFETVAGLAP